MIISREKAEAPYYALTQYMMLHSYLLEDTLSRLGIFDDIVYDFMMKKWRYMACRVKYDVNIISLGNDCMTHLIMVRNGLAFTDAQRPSYLKGRMPFNQQITPMQTLINLFQNDFKGYYADKTAINTLNQKYFLNESNGIIFVHDHFDERCSYTENMNRFNNQIAPASISLFLQQVHNYNTLFVVNILKEKDLDDLQQLNSIVTNKYNSKLVAISQFKLSDSSPIPHFQYHFPTHDYSFWQAEKYLNYNGYDFDKGIADFIMDFIVKHYSATNKYIRPLNVGMPTSNLYVYLAYYLYYAGEYEAAKAALKQSLRLAPGKVHDLWHLLASALQKC